MKINSWIKFSNFTLIYTEKVWNVYKNLNKYMFIYIHILEPMGIFVLYMYIYLKWSVENTHMNQNRFRIFLIIISLSLSSIIFTIKKLQQYIKISFKIAIKITAINHKNNTANCLKTNITYVVQLKIYYIQSRLDPPSGSCKII